MSCKITKCSTPTCVNTDKACKLINGKCKECHEKALAVKIKNNKP